MIAEHYVSRPQLLRDGYPRPFLSNTRMNRTKQFSIGEKAKEALFKKPYPESLLYQTQIYSLFHWIPAGRVFH